MIRSNDLARRSAGGIGNQTEIASLSRVWEDLLVSKVFSAYEGLWRMSLLERAKLVQEGAPSAVLVHIARDMKISCDRLGFLIGVPKSTATRRNSAKKPFSADESERLVGVAKLIGQVEAIVKESGEQEGFNSAEWFAGWINQPSAALGGTRPADVLATADGREAISHLLAQMQSGAYA